MPCCSECKNSLLVKCDLSVDGAGRLCYNYVYSIRVKDDLNGESS